MVTECPPPYTYPPTLEGRYVVYRLFLGEELAYVGFTNNLTRRLVQHRRYKSWARFVDHVDCYPVATRAQALTVEAEMIRAENPIFNIVRPGV